MHGMAWMNHKEPPNKVGLMYMLRGDGGASNTDPYAGTGVDFDRQRPQNFPASGDASLGCY
jgi:hypothetical protein